MTPETEPSHSKPNSFCIPCLSRLCRHVMPEKTPTLAPREIEVLQLVAHGLANKEIGFYVSKQHLSEGTVKVYLARIFRKLGVSSRTEAVVWLFSHRELLGDLLPKTN